MGADGWMYGCTMDVWVGKWGVEDGGWLAGWLTECPLCQIGGLSLSYLAAICNSLWRRHPLCQIRGLSLFHLLHTNPREKAHSPSDWRPLSFLSSCFMQLMSRRRPLYQIGSFSLSNLLHVTPVEKAPSLSVARPVTFPSASYNSQREGTLSDCCEASHFSICYMQRPERRHPLCQIGGLSLSYIAAICT